MNYNNNTKTIHKFFVRLPTIRTPRSMAEIAPLRPHVNLLAGVACVIDIDTIASLTIMVNTQEWFV